MTKESRGYKRKNVHGRKLALCPSEDSRGKYYFTLKLAHGSIHNKQILICEFTLSPRISIWKLISTEKLSRHEITATRVYVWLWKQVPYQVLPLRTWWPSYFWSFSTLFSCFFTSACPNTRYLVSRGSRASSRECFTSPLYSPTHLLLSLLLCLVAVRPLLSPLLCLVAVPQWLVAAGSQMPKMAEWSTDIRTASSVPC